MTYMRYEGFNNNGRDRTAHGSSIENHRCPLVEVLARYQQSTISRQPRQLPVNPGILAQFLIRTREKIVSRGSFPVLTHTNIKIDRIQVIARMGVFLHQREHPRLVIEIGLMTSKGLSSVPVLPTTLYSQFFISHWHLYPTSTSSYGFSNATTRPYGGQRGCQRLAE
jgi:hypothetical protein